jgi:hypothetical protein
MKNSAIRRFLAVFGVVMVILWGACSFLQEILEPQDVAKVVEESIKDSIPPTLTITSPTNGQEVGTSYQITGTVDDKGGSGVDRVMVKVNEGAYSEAEIVGKTWTSTVNVTNRGFHTNFVYAEDKAKNVAEVQTVWVESKGIPSCLITYPENGSILNKVVST